MLKTRLIPVLLLRNGLLVRSEEFREHQAIGNPVSEVRRFNEWNVDELVYLDITRDEAYGAQRDDHRVQGLGSDPLSILDAVSATCFMPLTFGGRIRSVDDMHERFRRGADKVTVNTGAYREPALISDGARAFGSQAIVVCTDVLRHPDERCEVMVDGGREATGADPAEWAQEAEARGAGEILLQSVDRDGTGRGYDLDLIAAVASATRIPVVALGGVGRYEQYAAGIEAGASAVAAANIFHFREMSDRGGKRALRKAGVEVRL